MLHRFQFQFVVAILLPLTGCSTLPAKTHAPSPAPVNHIVFLKLHDFSLVEQLIDESNEQLRSIPSVISYFAGKHIDIGRDSVLHDYDVALYLGFDSAQGLRQYVEHPQHIEFVNAWRPKLAWLRVYDVGNEAPR